MRIRGYWCRENVLSKLVGLETIEDILVELIGINFLESLTDY